MKPFNLEEYLKDPNRKVVTRDGRDVRIICTDKKGGGAHPIVALCPVPKKHLGEIICTFCANGEFTMGIESGYDLFFAPTKHEGWINIFKNIYSGNHYMGDSRVFKSKEDAEKEGMKCLDYISTIKIEWEE